MKYLTSEIRNQLLQHAAIEITGRYNELAADLVSVVCTSLEFCLPSMLLFLLVNSFVLEFQIS